ncbi:MAG: hypothetical protein Q8P84_08735 [Deltaproteobacteria bacterium]|nr:hypothetical protein [Deltaproteobacteria bacterium]
MVRPRFSICGGFLLFLFLVPSISIGAQQADFSKFKNVPKYPPVKIPQLPDVAPPAIEHFVKCNDPDGGDALTKGSASKKSIIPITLKDRCVSGEKPAETFLKRLEQLWRRYARRTPGLHDGSYHTKLEEAVCKGEPKVPAYADLDCAAISMSCLDGHCQKAKENFQSVWVFLDKIPCKPTPNRLAKRYDRLKIRYIQ